ncbi:hypothetical protein O7608_25985 [Solwaraspora sp. WMMA2056]|uniref:hypothetical protein n=1 Tax=Solwaraspora sp. WMMA2056 TaxID=3015161 RepID=UPI00259B967E|nr:hypothetical protein [Solwaraspora sp. WMMA2056]WJK39857.1 hypothetical protein O7608_25985 [Solwaraspora sp. WMMA2056]
MITAPPPRTTSRWDRIDEYGLLFVLVASTAPLALSGLSWLLFGGRSWVINLAAAVVTCALAAGVVLRRGGDLPVRWVAVGAAAAGVAVIWSVIGIAHHGTAQTVTGLRLILIPVALAVIVAALAPDAVRRLLTALSWMVVANAVAGVAQVLIGPATLVEWGFSPHHNVRYIDGVFRVPGLTEFNAELGLLAGAYLLGYVACWLTPKRRPLSVLWHVAATAAVLCLVLSTSRSGALLVVAGVTGALVLPYTRSRARRLLAVAIAGSIAVGVAATFVVIGAGGTASLFERFGVWGDLLATVPLAGDGIGAAGGASYSRVASSPPRFVDNYFLNVGLQFGPVVMVLLLAATAYALVRLARASAGRPELVLPIALLSGLAGASLTVDTWEFASTMLTLILFGYHGLRPDPTASDPARR